MVGHLSNNASCVHPITPLILKRIFIQRAKRGGIPTRSPFPVCLESSNLDHRRNAHIRDALVDMRVLKSDVVHFTEQAEHRGIVDVVTVATSRTPPDPPTPRFPSLPSPPSPTTLALPSIPTSVKARAIESKLLLKRSVPKNAVQCHKHQLQSIKKSSYCLPTRRSIRIGRARNRRAYLFHQARITKIRLEDWAFVIRVFSQCRPKNPRRDRSPGNIILCLRRKRHLLVCTPRSAGDLH